MPALRQIWTRESSITEVEEVAHDVVKALITHNPFRLWLIGDLGAGKTYIAGQILYTLGLPSITPVPSPTFTYCNEYLIGTDWYAHLDLYRAGPGFTLEDIGLVDARSYRGFLIEWPDMVPSHPLIACDFQLEIDFIDSQHRRYVLSTRS